MTFNCFVDLECSFTQTLEISNVAGPELICFDGDITGSSTDGSCEGFVDVPSPTFDSSCNDGIVITHGSEFGVSELKHFLHTQYHCVYKERGDLCILSLVSCRFNSPAHI